MLRSTWKNDENLPETGCKPDFPHTTGTPSGFDFRKVTRASCVAILVNYHASRLIIEAVASVLEDPACDEIHVVDNSVSEAEADWLQGHLPPSVCLTVAKENLGFVGACNLVFAKTKSEYVLLLNPDARLMANALQTMLILAANHLPKLGWAHSRPLVHAFSNTAQPAIDHVQITLNQTMESVPPISGKCALGRPRPLETLGGKQGRRFVRSGFFHVLGRF